MIVDRKSPIMLERFLTSIGNYNDEEENRSSASSQGIICTYFYQIETQCHYVI